MKVAGVVLLATLVIYKDLNGKPFHTSWWGILGLIGWTYAVCAGIYLFTRESLRKKRGCMVCSDNAFHTPTPPFPQKRKKSPLAASLSP